MAKVKAVKAWVVRMVNGEILISTVHSNKAFAQNNRIPEVGNEVIPVLIIPLERKEEASDG